MGCYVVSSEELPFRAPLDPSQLAPRRCAAACAVRNYTLAAVGDVEEHPGAEPAPQCRCGGDRIANLTNPYSMSPTVDLQIRMPVADPSQCLFPCPGNPHMRKCGGPGTATLYRVWPAEFFTPGATDDDGIPVNYGQIYGHGRVPVPDVEEGCYTAARLGALRELPHEVTAAEEPVLVDNPPMSGLTPTRCRRLCRIRRMPFAGVEGGSRCFCGVERPRTQQLAKESCQLPCAGDPHRLECGGHHAVFVYSLWIPPAGNIDHKPGEGLRSRLVAPPLSCRTRREQQHGGQRLLHL
jgi:hypothetical protein